MCCHSFWMMVKLCIYELVQFSEKPYRMVILWALVLQVLKLSTEHLGSHLSLHRRAWDSSQVSEAHGVNLYWLREKKQPLFVRPLSSPLHPYWCILLSPNSISTPVLCAIVTGIHSDMSLLLSIWGKRPESHPSERFPLHSLCWVVWMKKMKFNFPLMTQ